MIRVFAGTTANEVWRAAAELLQRDSQLVANPLGGGSRELHHVGLSIDNPRERWVFARDPALNPAFALAEVVWILRGRNDAAFLSHWNRSLSQFVGPTHSHLHGAYGHRLRAHLGLDQLTRASRALATMPASRQVVLQVWDAVSDLPLEDGTPVSKDVPCNVLACLKVVRGRLEWLQIVRSNDLFRGLPYNLVQWTCLQEIIAGWIGVDVGSYNQISDSLHLYDSDASSLTISRVTPATNPDSMSLPQPQCESEFARVEEYVERLALHGASAVEEVLACDDVCRPLRNWLAVFCAETYRRERERDLAFATIAQCRNPALALAWTRWELRLSAGRATAV